MYDCVVWVCEGCVFDRMNFVISWYGFVLCFEFGVKCKDIGVYVWFSGEC